jgi:carbonic anhydrase/acetyltransferase-like protein (isoleucine patch superfamily)
MLRKYRSFYPTLGERVFVDESAVVIGNVVLGDDASVWPLAALRGDMGKSIRIGARTNIQDNAVLHIVHAGKFTGDGLDLSVGDDTTVGHGAILHACTIGNGCLIGMGAVVLDGAVVEDGAFVAAGSIVTPGKRLAGGWLYRGSPAAPARPLSDTEKQQLLYSAENYVRLKDEYLQEASAEVRAHD